MKGSKVGKIVGWVFIGIAIAAVLGLVLGFGLQWLWNQLMPEIFGLPRISYWQAVGLFVLAHLLFKGHNHHGPRGKSEDDCFPSRRRRRRVDCSEEKDPTAEKIRRLLDDTEETASKSE